MKDLCAKIVLIFIFFHSLKSQAVNMCVYSSGHKGSGSGNGARFTLYRHSATTPNGYEYSLYQCETSTRGKNKAHCCGSWDDALDYTITLSERYSTFMRIDLLDWGKKKDGWWISKVKIGSSSQGEFGTTDSRIKMRAKRSWYHCDPDLYYDGSCIDGEKMYGYGKFELDRKECSKVIIPWEDYKSEYSDDDMFRLYCLDGGPTDEFDPYDIPQNPL